MKKFILHVLLFFIFIILIDRVFGLTMDYLRDHVKGGDTYMISYTINHVHPDILILGSSRAYHHIVPEILEDSLGLSCYNGGYNACSIIPMYCRYLSVKKRLKPQIVIYEIYSDTDILMNNKADNVDNIKIFYDNHIISGIIDDVNPSSKYKMISSLYRYNSKVNGVIKDYLKPSEVYNKGYSPFYKEMNYEPYVIDKHFGDTDYYKLKYLNKLVDDTKKENIRLIFTVSPWYRCNDESEYTLIKDLCKRKGITYISHLTDTVINSHKEFFADQAHLNDKGARLYSRMLASDIRELINKQ